MKIEAIKEAVVSLMYTLEHPTRAPFFHLAHQIILVLPLALFFTGDMSKLRIAIDDEVFLTLRIRLAKNAWPLSPAALHGRLYSGIWWRCENIQSFSVAAFRLRLYTFSGWHSKISFARGLDKRHWSSGLKRLWRRVGVC